MGTRAKPLGAAGSSGPLRVALPDESSSSKSNKTATVKPFQSPNSKNQNNKAAGGMGDVAAVRGNWRPLAMNSSNSNQQRGDVLAEQRRQMAEIERLRSAEAASGGGYQNRNTARSQSVLPPSGASRPTNHLEVNKMAQVSKLVPGISASQCRAALEAANWDTSVAVKNLKVDKLYRIGVAEKVVCEKVLKSVDWDLERAAALLLE